MAKILLTGAAGFIGSHTADLLLAEGHEVIGIDNLRTGHLENLALANRQPRFRFLKEDITHDGLLARIATAEKPDAILHLAALVSVPESFKDPGLNRRLNVGATHFVVDAAIASGSVRRIAFASSAAVYGANSNLPLQETEKPAPLSPYGEAKLTSEGILTALSRSDPSISTVALRYFNVYGQRQDPRSPYSGVISLLAAAFREGRPFSLEGDGGQTRDFIAVADVARANLLALTRPATGSHVVNVCTGKATSLMDVITAMEKICGHPLNLGRRPPREGDIRNSLGSPAAATALLDFRSKLPIETGLRAFME